jgi:hypothetical protein
VAVTLWAAAPSVWGSSDVKGEVREFRSSGGIVERCIALARMPGGAYSAEDAAQEAALCAIDFTDGQSAVCPKVFSTSPGSLIYDLRGGPFAGRAADFEERQCIAGGVVREGVSGPPVSYKMSVNGHSTSATFANSALLYYHFARYFDASAHVPVAVFRSMDTALHRQRVSARGLSLSAGRTSLRMNHAAWQILHDVEGNPDTYSPRDELFTRDGQVYGVLLRPSGARYNEAVNGTRASGWGDGQNRDFQETAPFRALRNAEPLDGAIAGGLAEAAKNPVLAKATGPDSSATQIAFWMSDLIDVTLLDFIFSQQDRVGNIDYLTYWYWIQDGRVERRPADGRTPPADLAGYHPVLLKRTELGDNDAGVRVGYVNFAKRTGMLEGLRHYRAGVYEKLIALHDDFVAQGPLYVHVRDAYGLSARELEQVVTNTSAAAAILHAQCSAGHLRFDVEPDELLLRGKVEARTIDCGAL